jgi:hypothetical protein
MEEVMAKRVVIGLFVLSLMAVGGGIADAGCIGNPPFCAAWITGSGMPTGLVTRQTAGVPQNELACPSVVTFQDGGGEGGGEEFTLAAGIIIQQITTPAINLRLVGTIPTTESPQCGLTNAGEFCDIAGVAICGNSVNKKATTPGPLRVSSPNGFGQTDGSTDNANFRFQLGQFEQDQLCPGDSFIAFFAREGFFEACVGADCLQEFCKVDVGGINRDVPRTYNCKPI